MIRQWGEKYHHLKVGVRGFELQLTLIKWQGAEVAGTDLNKRDLRSHGIDMAALERI